MTHGKTFYEIAAILGLATALGMAGQKLRQPLIIMFLATGILAGPSGLGIIQSYDQIALLAQIGIALLLFIVGLKLDLNLIRTTGPVALATGLGQIIFTSVIGFGIAIALGMKALPAAYVAVALTFSSTIIIVKLLSDKKEIDSLHGQIAVGFLIVQDIAAILALVGLTTLGSPLSEEGSALSASLFIAAKGALFLGFIAAAARFVLPGLTRRLAHSQEMLALFAIAWAIFLGAGGEWLGFSKEVGAFLAGVSLASTGFRDAIGVRLASLRDFLLLFFFIDLGARLEWSMVGAMIFESSIFSLFVLLGNPLIVLIIMGVMGYRRRTGFMAGLTVAQISEFSLIVAALGLQLGHISREVMGLITLVGVVTIFASTYMILYSGQLYQALSGPLKIFERRNPLRESARDSMPETQMVDVILVGLGNYGSGLVEYLLRRNKKVIGVDFDPAALEKWKKRGLPVLYGDMADPEIHEHLPLDKTRWVVSTIRLPDLNLSLVHHLKRRGYEGKVALTASNRREAARFEEAGAQVIFRPFADAAEQAADALTNAMDILPEKVNWPLAFREVRVRPGAAVAGQTIRNIPLHSAAGVSILAASRAGSIFFDPDPDLPIQTGDRLVIMGPPEEIKKAEEMLNQFRENGDSVSADRFIMAEIIVPETSSLSGQTLAEANFRRKHRVTVVGIHRGEDIFNVTSPNVRIEPNDHLIVIGSSLAVEKLKNTDIL